MADPKILLNAFNLKPAAAMEFLRRKGYTFSPNSWLDVWKDAHARAFTVARVTKVELLRDIRKLVEKAVAEGKTLQQFKTEFKEATEAQRRSLRGADEKYDKALMKEYATITPERLKTIYHTNLQTAYMAGHYKGMMEAAENMPYWQYMSVIDNATTSECRKMHERVFRYDDPMWKFFFPPNGWNCRSTVVSLTERQVERMGLEVESSEGRIEEKYVTVGKGENARLEKVSGLKLPNGETFWTGPGWDYNPGREAWMPDLDIYHRDLAKQFVADQWQGPQYTRFLEAKGAIGGAIPIAVMTEGIKEKLGADSAIVLLTAYTLWKNADHHKDLNTQDYLNLQYILDDAKVISRSFKRPWITLFYRSGGKNYCAVLRVSDDRGKKIISLASFRRASSEEIEKAGIARDGWEFIKE